MVSTPLTPHALYLTPLPLKLTTELLTTYGSPLYVYAGDRLRQTIRHITQAISYPKTQFHFASVTNGNVALLKIFQAEGWGLHANTPGDIYLGLHAGFHPSQIIYSGSNLSRSEMEQVLRWGIQTLNLDSLSQLQLCCELWQLWKKKEEGSGRKEERDAALHLGLRLNAPELTGDSRIGVQLKEFPRAIAIAQQAGLKLGGLHFYRGTGTNATKAFTQVMDQVLTISQTLPDWEYLDFGGGFGYPYHHDGIAFDWQQFGAELSDRLHRLNKPIKLVIEPGRAAIAGCATLLTKVVSIKWQDNRQIVGVDTTVANLSVPSVHGSYREIVAQVRTHNPPLHPTDVCGNTTYSRDYLGRNCQLPALEIGDTLAILDVGAYGYAMSSHFLHRLRPAEVLLEESDKHRLIRKREGYSSLLENQLLE